MSQLDRNKPYGEVFGAQDGHRFEQGGKKFDNSGDEVVKMTPAQIAAEEAETSLLSTAGKIANAIQLGTAEDGSPYAAEAGAADFKELPAADYIMKHMGYGKYNVLTADGVAVETGLDKTGAGLKLDELNAGSDLDLDAQLQSQGGPIAPKGEPGATADEGTEAVDTQASTETAGE
jgi:hypothetical protein